MSRENIETVRRVYEAFNCRDLAGVLDLFDADFEWVPDGRALDQAVTGREGVERYFGDLIEFVDARVEPEEYFDKDDQVICFVRVRTRGQASGAEIDIEIAHVWTFRGKMPVRGDAYAERGKALEAVGLRE